MTVLDRWVRRATEHRPPGPFRPGFWRSPLRGPWFTAVLSAALLPGITVLFLTGLVSYAAYNPNLAPGNDTTPDKGLLGSWLPGWPAGPSWLYWVNQGVHVTLGLVLIPIVLAKLWSVLPKLFEWPPARSLPHLVERASLLLLVGGAVFELVTGVMNIQYYYAWPFGFYQAHYYGAWVFIAAFVVHVAFRLPRMVSALRARSLRQELRTPVSQTVAEQPDPDHLVSDDPAAATISRRGALGLVAASALALLGLSVGQSIGGAARSSALLAPRGQDTGTGPADFQVNKTALEAGIGPVDGGWRLELTGATRLSLSRAQLLALPQHTARLPIACVEGWSTGVQTWTGVRLADLAAMVRAAPETSLFVESLQRGGGFGSATLSAGQVQAADAVLALRVNGVDLSADHGFPARVVVPALPGVHNTKWVSRMTFQPPAGAAVTRRETLQLLALLASFIVALYAGVKLLAGSPIGTGAWFVGSAVIHDLVLFPLYAGVDAALVLLLRRRPELATVAGVAWLNYLRFPVVISGLLLLVWSPLILRLSPAAYHAASGLSAQPFLPRWLVVTAVLFAISAAVLGARVALVHVTPGERGRDGAGRR